MRSQWRCAALLIGGLLIIVPRLRASAELQWDAVEKSCRTAPGERVASFRFTATNSSPQPVQIRSAGTSCGCTTATLPVHPWVLARGESGTLVVQVDIRGRRGLLTKTVTLDTSLGREALTVHVFIPLAPEAQRAMNLEIAQANRQAVLHGDCASCHVAPTVGKTGADLFATACLICHRITGRASMVPDLMKPTVKRNAAYWSAWIRDGGASTLMPAFAKANGGVLDDSQIESLVAYLTANLPNEPARD
jgi:mono/diheme cytochrome c family protein